MSTANKAVPDLDVIEENAEEMLTGMENIKVLLREPSARRIFKERTPVLQPSKEVGIVNQYIPKPLLYRAESKPEFVRGGLLP